LAVSILIERTRILVNEKISLMKDDYRKFIITKESNERKSGELK